MSWAIVSLTALLLGALLWVYNLGRRVERLAQKLSDKKKDVKRAQQIQDAQNEIQKGYARSEEKKAVIRDSDSYDDLRRLFHEITGLSG